MVGLGNPGAKYAGTRHNVGFDAVDALAARLGTACDRTQCRAVVGRGLVGSVSVVKQKRGWKNKGWRGSRSKYHHPPPPPCFPFFSFPPPPTHTQTRILLAKPQTYMNLSGESVAALTAFYRIPPGRVILVYDDMDTPLGAARLRSKGGAGGHNGVKSVLQRLGGDAPFVRVRIGVGRPPPHIPVVDWVLTRFASEDDRAAAAAGVEAGVEAARAVLEIGLEKALSGKRVGGGARAA